MPGVVPGQSIWGIPAINFPGFISTQPGFPFEQYAGLITLDAPEDSADFNGDDDIDGIDFIAWQRGFGLTSGATKAQGDADNNGTVDTDDLAIWENQYATLPPLAAAATVPEPTSCFSLIAAGLCMVHPRLHNSDS